MTPNPENWALSPRETPPDLRWANSGTETRLVAFSGEEEVRHWDLLALETIFHPARFQLAQRRALVVPIRPEWADAMLDYPEQQLDLLANPERSERLLLRSQNAYYCYPTALDIAVKGTPILFMVSGGLGLVGEARIINSVVDAPEELFARFGGSGSMGSMRSAATPAIAGG